ncbi:MAG: hypothetical protein WC453_02725 [Patescibacteria group bacterium]
MKKVYVILSIIIALLVLLFLAFRFMPARYIMGILGDDNKVSTLACSYPLRVAGDSMEPNFKSGQTVIFDKCFVLDDLAINQIIAFKSGGVIRLGAIDKIEDSSQGLVYKVIQFNRRDRISDVSCDQIVAVYKKELGGQPQTGADQQTDKPMEIKTSDYSLTLPAGWQAATAGDGQSIYININEAPFNDFRTYLSVGRDKVSGGTLNEYFDNLKNEIKKSVAGIVFDNENSVTINGQAALATEAYVRQNNADFKILTVAVTGRGDDIWIFNFNSLASKWEDNAPIFEQILKSLIIK